MNVYRFRNKVAITPDEGPTFYIKADSADELADALTRVAEDVRGCKFTDSTVGTIEVPVLDD